MCRRLRKEIILMQKGEFKRLCKHISQAYKGFTGGLHNFEYFLVIQFIINNLHKKVYLHPLTLLCIFPA